MADPLRGAECESSEAMWADLLGALNRRKTGTFAKLHELSEPKSNKKRSAYRGAVVELTDFDDLRSG